MKIWCAVMRTIKRMKIIHAQVTIVLDLGKDLKKVIVSQRNVNQIAYTSILQFGENYGLGRYINEGLFLG